jgi:hypothetical protein
MWNLSGVGLTYKGGWIAGTYQKGDVVIDNGVTYLANKNTSQRPTGWQIGRSSIQRITSAQMTALTPYDGQEILLIVDDTNGIVWRLRYNSASASAYKWEFLGGPNQTAFITTFEPATATTSWHDLATVGPQITVVRAGDYLVTASAQTQSAVSASTLYIGVVVGASSTTPVIQMAATSAGSYLHSLSISPFLVTGVPASGILKVRYYTTAAGASQTWGNRNLAIIPVRLA